MAMVLVGTRYPAHPLALRLRQSRLRVSAMVLIVVGTFVRAYSSGEVIQPGVELLLVLTLERCLFRDRLREQLQLLLLSSVLVIIAGVIHVGPDYPVLVGVFVMVALAHLGFWNLEREAERIGARARFALSTQGDQFSALVTRHSLGLGAGVLTCAFLVFVFFPRIGAGVFFRGQRASQAQAGFSDEVSLGHRGDIANNPKIVARVYPDSAELKRAPTLGLYFRVSAFDRYEQGRWLHSSQAHQAPLRANMHRYSFSRTTKEKARLDYLIHHPKAGPRFNRVPGWASSDQVTRVRILQEDLGTQHLILPTQPVLVQWLARGALEERVRLESGRDEQVKARGLGSGSMQFQVDARTTRPSPQELHAIGRPRYSSAFAPYLQLPSTLSPAFAKYAEELASGSTLNPRSQQAILAEITKALGRFRYTTQHQEPSPVFAERDPIEAFLLDTQAGHCEYFASALVLLARSQGIPARVVNGYYGAYPNPVDGTFQIAQSQAHAWVEIYFAGLGWILFDATPAQERPSAPSTSSFASRLRSLYQALETKYLEYVVDYDGKKQWSALKGLRSGGERLSTQQLIVALLILLGAALAWRLRGYRPTPRNGSVRILVAQQRLHDTLVAQGLEPNAQENAISWAKRAAHMGLGLDGTLLKTVQQSEQLRFGPGPMDRDLLRACLKELHEISRSISALDAEK